MFHSGTANGGEGVISSPVCAFPPDNKRAMRSGRANGNASFSRRIGGTREREVLTRVK